MSEPNQGLAPADQVPTMSTALEKWLEREVSTRVEISPAGQVTDWWSDFDNCGQLEMAARVRRGFRLTQIRAASDKDFVAGLKARDIALGTAYQLMDCYRLFVEFPKLDLLDRAAALGFARIRELKPHLGLDGIRQLVEGKQVDTLGYEQALGMSKREIITWRKQRAHELLAADAAKRGIEVPEASDDPDEPRELQVARDELLGAALRAQLELQRARRIMDELLPQADDEWKAARVELAHAARTVVADVSQQSDAMLDLLANRFGVATMRPMQGEYRTLPRGHLHALGADALVRAEADTLARTKARQARLKQRGAPPKSLEALIANALGAHRG